MRFDINQVMLGLNGKPLTGLFGPNDEEAITYARLFVLVASNGDPTDTAEQKYKSYKLGVKLVGAGNGLVDLEDTETVRIKELVGKNYTPTVYGRTVDFLASPVAAAPSPKAVEVSSTNQSGGITAAVVAQGPAVPAAVAQAILDQDA